MGTGKIRRELPEAGLRPREYVALLDRDLAFTWINGAFARAARRNLASLLGLGFFEVYPNPANEAIFRRVLETGRGFVARSGLGRVLRLSESSECRWDLELSRVHGEDGAPTGVLVVLRNVSCRVPLEREPLLGLSKADPLQAIHEFKAHSPYDRPFRRSIENEAATPKNQ